MPTIPAARRPHATIWGFHPAHAKAPRDVDAILVIAADPEICRALAQRLADAGYGVEWTIDARIVPAWVAVRRYALLVADDCPSEITAADPGLPVLPIPEPCTDDTLLARVASCVRCRGATA